MVKMVGFHLVSKNYYGWSEGLKRHGDSYELIKDFDPNAHYEADCFYQTNLLKPKFMHSRLDQQGIKYMYIRDSKKPFIVSESEPFRDYPGWLRFGWNEYGWEQANCNNENVGRERWNRFETSTGIKFKDWHSPGSDIIIMGQKEGDSALVRLYEQGYKSFYDWVFDIVKQIRKHSDRRIIIRPHPRGLDRGLKNIKRKLLDKFDNVELSDNIKRGGNRGGESLLSDFQRAHCIITFNSLSAVEAVTNGIPTYALDSGSMIWPIAHQDISKIESLNYNIDITDWQNKIAYTFWNKQDVKSGETWEHLKKVYFNEN